MTETQTTLPNPRAYVAFGLVLALIGTLLWLGDRDLAADGRRTTGVVTGFDGVGASSHAVVEFADARGNPHSFRAGSNRDLALQQDEAVTVLYDPADPARATVDSFAARALLPYAFLGFGLLVALLGLASLRKLRQGGSRP